MYLLFHSTCYNLKSMRWLRPGHTLWAPNTMYTVNNEKLSDNLWARQEVHYVIPPYWNTCYNNVKQKRRLHTLLRPMCNIYRHTSHSGSGRLSRAYQQKKIMAARNAAGRLPSQRETAQRTHFWSGQSQSLSLGASTSLFKQILLLRYVDLFLANKKNTNGLL